MRWSLVVLQVLVAAASAINVISFRLQNLLAPQSAQLDRSAILALAAIVALSVVAVLAWRFARASRAVRASIAVAALLLTMAAGFAPRVVEAHRQAAAQAAQTLEGQRREEAFSREMREWKDEVDGRAATLRPFETDQAWALVNFVSDAGRRSNGPDAPSAQALTLLRMALQAKIIDVNAPVQGARLSDVSPRPLFLQFYKEKIEPMRRATAIAAQDWAIMQQLAAAGADLTLPDAAPLVADLAKTPAPGAGQFIGLR